MTKFHLKHKMRMKAKIAVKRKKNNPMRDRVVIEVRGLKALSLGFRIC